MKSRSDHRPIRKSEINRLIAVLRENGINLTGAEILPDGAIRLLSDSTPSTRASEHTAFDVWWREHGEET